MRKNVIAETVTAAVMAALMVTGCGSVGNGAVSSEAAAEASKAIDSAASEVSDVIDSAASDMPDVSEAIDEATAGVSEAVDEAVAGASEAIDSAMANFVYMGGLYISDPENDLMMSLFRDGDGNPVVIVEKHGEFYYDDLNTEDGTLEDGREYTKLLIEGKEFGYHFKLEDEDTDSFMVDEDGTVYPAKEVDESAAFDMLKNVLE